MEKNIGTPKGNLTENDPTTITIKNKQKNREEEGKQEGRLRVEGIWRTGGSYVFKSDRRIHTQ